MAALFDTHCHLDFSQFDADREAVFSRAAAAGVTRILIPGTDLSSSRAAVRLAGELPGVRAAVGIHPNEPALFDERTLSELEQLARQPNVLSIGEIGLDYYRDRVAPSEQQRRFRAQLELAARLELPVIIHNRQASADVLAMLAEWMAQLQSSRSPLRERPGVLHSFDGSAEDARRAIELGFYIGLTGPVTYKNAADKQALAASLPLNRLLLETDAPYLTPHPHRGRRNEPAFVLFVAEKVAELRSQPLDVIAGETTSNALRLFAWRD